MQDSQFISDSFAFDTNVKTPRKEGLADKFRHKINVVGARRQPARQARVSIPNLTNLTTRSQVRDYEEKKKKNMSMFVFVGINPTSC